MTKQPTIPQGRYIAAARAALGMARADLAKAAGVSVSMLGDWERGARSPVRNNKQAVFATLDARGIVFIRGAHGLIYGLRWPPESK